MNILISLTLFSILFLLYNILIDDDTINLSIILLILVILIGWVVIGNTVSIDSKDRLIKTDSIQNYNVIKFNNVYIIEDENMIGHKIKIDDTIKNIKTEDLKVNVIQTYNLYNSKLDIKLKLIKK